MPRLAHWEQRAAQYASEYDSSYGPDSTRDRNSELIAHAALTLTPIGGVIRGARALRWGYHGLRGSRFYRRGKKGFRFRDKKTGRWRSRPPTVRHDLHQAQAHARHGYRRGVQAVDRRLPLRGPRHLVDKWQGRAELVTRPTAYLERRALGRLVPGGVYTIGGVKYVATRLSSSPSSGSGGPADLTPTHPRVPGNGTATNGRKSHDRAKSRSRGSRQARRPRARGCPPGHYYSFKSRRCVRSRYR